MPSILSGPTAPAASGGQPRQLVVMLHGVGADGQDLIDLAPYFARDLPDAEFLSPDAPFPYDMAPYGRQWFSLSDRRPDAIAAGVRATAPLVNRYLDEELARRGLADHALAMIGFSQGTMMALHVALRRMAPCAAVLGYSGMLAAADDLADEITARPPVLLVHGERDDVVPASAMPLAAAALTASGVPVETHLQPQLGHGVDEAGIASGRRFLVRHFARLTE